MLAAIATDLAAIEGTAVDVLHDVRHAPVAVPGINVTDVRSAAEEQRALWRLAGRADWTLLIAPEFDEHLLLRARLVERCGGRLLGPSSQLVALASDKHATAEHLARHGVPVPRGLALEPGEPLPGAFEYPAVLKPRDGAGSLGIEWVGNRRHERRVPQHAARLERYQPGVPASVAVLCGTGMIVPLVPCGQRLASETDFSYLGGWLPLAPRLAARAGRLARQAASALPEPLGYVGIDMVLGADPAGSGDVVVEVNPRLTTSYVGLRAFSRSNLAAAMIAVAQGSEPQLCWNLEAIQFTSDGTCVLLTAPE